MISFRLPHLLLASVSLSLLASAAAAQSGPDTAGDTGAAPAADGTAGAGRDSITVTATRQPIEAFSYPGSVSVIDRAEIEDLNPSTAADLLDMVPGVRFLGGPRRTGEVPSVRGMEGEGVLILFDGIRQNFLSGHDGQFFIEPDLLKSVEVVRGPASALYGSGALGGVIAFRMADAANFLRQGARAGVRVKGGYQGVNDEWMGSGTAFARSDDGRFDGIANLTYRNSGNISLGNGADLQSDDEIASGLVKGRMTLADGLSATLTGVTFNNDAVEPNNGQDVLATERVEKDISSHMLRAGLDFNPAANDLVDATFAGFLNDTQVDESETDSSRSISRNVETRGFVFDNRSRIALGGENRLALTYGGDYYRDRQTGTDNTTANGGRGGVPDATARTLGLFAQAELSLSSAIGEFIVIPGIRHDSFENRLADGTTETDDGATSPKIGATWKPVPWLMVFANYAEAFRAPSYNEIFADDIHFVIPLGPGIEAPNSFVANPDLKPEQSKTWEWGGGLDFDRVFARADRFSTKAAYYESDVRNLIDLAVDMTISPSCFVPTIPGPCTAGTSHYTNTGRAELSGFELEASYDHPRLFLTAAYSSITGRDKATGDYVGVLSPDRVNLGGGLKLPEIDSRLGSRVEIAEDFDKVNDPADAREGYGVVDVYFVWAPSRGALQGLRLDLGIDNVADTDYERVFAGVPEPGRNYKIALSWTQML